MPAPLWLRSLATTLLFPGLVGGLVPALLGGGGACWPVALGPLRWLGVLPLALGIALLALTIHDFATIGGGTLAPWDAPRALVRLRLYGWVRNPMYLGVLGCIAGQALLWRSASVASYLVFLALVFHVRVVGFEEPELRRRFGEPYARYRASVPRWLPRRPAAR
ncbi:MAG: isoprenylcysteine carboxylmethyltransferase family protein [Deltaproteobacteria bacterium]|nr:isoprenylcysteine carboxylmethyltransferase family protein [Deltaproteobacteria bacterium]